MKDKENLEEELKNIAPFLSKMKRQEEGMQVPENYFQNLTEEMISQLNAENEVVIKDESSKQSWFSDFLENLQGLLQPRPVMAFASIVLLAFVGLFLLNPSESATTIQGLTEVSLEELELYLEANIEDYEAEVLVEGNEQILDNEFGIEDELEEYYEEIIDESDLEDLL